MASIIEAFDSTIKESFAGIKVLVWAVPVCMGYSMFNSALGNIIAIVTAVLFFGYLVQCSHNIIIKEDRILPGFNVLQYGLVGLIAMLVLLPYIGVGGIVAYSLLTFVKIPSPVWNQTFQIISVLLSVSVVLASYVVYARRLNPLEAFNMRKYFIGFFETFMSFSYLLVKLALWSVVIVGFLAYLFSLFVGFQNIIWTYIVCVISVFYCILGANYMAQVSDEIFTFVEKKDEENREKERIKSMGIE